MKILLNKKQLIKLIEKEKNIGFIPTMGAIHKGHISLFKKSNIQCKKTLVSIFINKYQFNKKKDYKTYPRINKKDVSLIKKSNVDYLFLPTNKQIYPSGPNKKIKINPFSKKLCGKYRPGHFESVVDVIDRFIKIIYPKKIYLGEKDFQQLKILEDHIKKKYKKISVVRCKTIREKNGLALSSRNSLLSKKEETNASKVYNFININKYKIIKKKIDIKFIRRKIIQFGISKIDYIEVVNINKITKPFKKKKKFKIFIAYYIGDVRLIDNI